jgi:hypothetical protein
MRNHLLVLGLLMTAAGCRLGDKFAGGPGQGSMNDMAMGGGGDDMDNTMPGADMAKPIPCNTPGGPACTWRWQAPTPQGDDFLAVVAFDDNNTFALTSDSTILHRDGAGWNSAATHPTLPDQAHLFALFSSGGSSTEMFAAGGVYTSPGGVTQTPIVFHSSDRGQTWMQETLPAGSTGGVTSGTTLGGKAIMLGANNVVFLRSAAGAWSKKTIGTSSTAVYAAVTMGSGSAVAVGRSGTSQALAYSNDDGNTWTELTTAYTSLTTSAVCLANGTTKTWWAVGGGGILSATGDKPSSWTSQGLPSVVDRTLRGCVAADAMHAWAYGDSVIVVTTDGGANWYEVAPATTASQSFLSGAHSSGAALTIVGQSGTIQRSINGADFIQEKTGLEGYFTWVYGPAPGVVFAVGSPPASGTPMVVKTTNDGASWTKLTAIGNNAKIVWGASATDVYLAGTNGSLAHSSDGTSFAPYVGSNAPPTTITFNDMFGSAELGVFAVGIDGAYPKMSRVIYRTTDHGTTWAPLSIVGLTDSSNSTNGLNTVFALGADAWIGTDAGVFHSTDGTSFAQQATNTTNEIQRIRGIDGMLLATLKNLGGAADYISSADKGSKWTLHTGAWNSFGEQLAIAPDNGTVVVFESVTDPQASFDKLGTWALLNAPIAPYQAMNGFAFASNDIFVVGQRGIIHYGN